MMQHGYREAYLIEVASQYVYSRRIPARWRRILGQRKWFNGLGKIPRSEAVMKCADLAATHDNLLVRLEEMGEDAARELRVAQLHEMAAAEKLISPHAVRSIDWVLRWELRALGWRPSRADQHLWADAFVRAGLEQDPDPAYADEEELAPDDDPS